MRFIDIHHHIVWGMDDGPSTFRGSARMMHAASEDGIRQIIATPHVRPGIVEFDTPEFMRRVAALNTYSAEHRLGLVVYPGSEIMYTDKTAEWLQERRVPTLADSTYVLVEFMPDVEYERILSAIRSLTNNGFTPVIAHIERYGCLVRKVGLVEELRGMFYMRAQINCSTIIKGRNRQLRKFVSQMIHNELVDYVATDAHNTDSRPVRMHECYDALEAGYGQGVAALLTGEKQEEIIIQKVYAAHQ